MQRVKSQHMRFWFLSLYTSMDGTKFKELLPSGICHHGHLKEAFVHIMQ